MLTEPQRFCLSYLSNKMEASAAMVGEHLIDKLGPTEGPMQQSIKVAAPVLGRLRLAGYVRRIRELHAWRITPEGRAALQESITKSGMAILDEMVAEAERLGLY